MREGKAFIMESESGSLCLLWGCNVIVSESFLNVFDKCTPDGAGILVYGAISSVVSGGGGEGEECRSFQDWGGMWGGRLIRCL